MIFPTQFIKRKVLLIASLVQTLKLLPRLTEKIQRPARANRIKTSCCKLFSQLDTLENRFDFLPIDTATGISSDIMYVNITANDIVVMMTLGVRSCTDAYAHLKLRSATYSKKNFKTVDIIVMNTIRGEKTSHRLIQKTLLIALTLNSTAAQRFQHFGIGLTNVPDGIPAHNDAPDFRQPGSTDSDDQPAASRRRSAKAA